MSDRIAAQRFTLVTRYGLALVIAGLALSSYKWIGDETTGRAQLNLLTPVDTAITFLPWTIWLYLPLFVFNFHYAVWAIEGRNIYLRTMASLVFGWFIAYPIFWLWPAAYPRPEVPMDGSIASVMLSLLQRFDPPTNTFPSLHVVDMACVSMGVWRFSERRGRFAILAAIPCALSILTTKQHFLADLIGGVAVASAAHYFAFQGYEDSPQERRASRIFGR